MLPLMLASVMAVEQATLFCRAMTCVWPSRPSLAL
jgi:hypothetical protein